MKKEDFLKGMTMMGIAYNKEYNQKELEVWYSMLGDYKVEDFSNAIQTLIKTLKRVPTIADITEQIAKEKTSNIPTAEDEWQEVLYAVRRYGSYREKEALESLKPYTAKIVGYIGYFRIFGYKYFIFLHRSPYMNDSIFITELYRVFHQVN